MTEATCRRGHSRAVPGIWCYQTQVHDTTTGLAARGVPSAWQLPQSAILSTTRNGAQLAAPLAARLRSLTYWEAGDGAADDHALNLAGALEDGEDLRVPVHTLHRVLPGVAVATEDLDRLLRHANGGLPRHKLRHRALCLCELAAMPGHPRGPPGQQPSRVHRGLHVREHERNRLVLPDRLAELDAADRVVPRILECRPRHADGYSGDRRPGRLERLHRGLLAAGLPCRQPRQPGVQSLLTANEATARDLDVVQNDLGGVRRPYPVLAELLSL